MTVDRLPDRPSDEKPEVVHVARCPEHGLHGERSECFVCGGEVEQVPLVPLSALAAVEADLAEARRENERLARLRAKVEAVERLHCECTTGNCACGGGPGWCHGCNESWPCSTRAALGDVDGETQP